MLEGVLKTEQGIIVGNFGNFFFFTILTKGMEYAEVLLKMIESKWDWIFPILRAQGWGHNRVHMVKFILYENILMTFTQSAAMLNLIHA